MALANEESISMRKHYANFRIWTRPRQEFTEYIFGRLGLADGLCRDSEQPSDNCLKLHDTDGFHSRAPEP